MITVTLGMVHKRHEQLVRELTRLRSHGPKNYMEQCDSAIGNIEAMMADVYAAYALLVDIKSISSNNLTGS